MGNCFQRSKDPDGFGADSSPCAPVVPYLGVKEDIKDEGAADAPAENTNGNSHPPPASTSIVDGLAAQATQDPPTKVSQTSLQAVPPTEQDEVKNPEEKKTIFVGEEKTYQQEGLHDYGRKK